MAWKGRGLRTGWSERSQDCRHCNRIVHQAGLEAGGDSLQFCSTGHNFALDGIAITEADQVIAHFIYEGAWDAEIDALPDVNRNGLSEILIDTRGTNMGEISAGVSIIEVSGKTIRKFGQSEVLSDSCGSQYASGIEAYKLYAKRGRTPVFYRAAFAKSCKPNAKWRTSGNLRVASLEENTIKYQSIK